tara:strand:- start:20470 stop:20982 length:513 start_codon:yes stop_codon:yes gene_type:complete
MSRFLPRRARLFSILLVLPVSSMASAPPAAAAEAIVGKARVIGGDIIEIDRQQIRLFGIDAPATAQTCTAAGRAWSCGQNADFALSAIVERQWVYCAPKPGTLDGRVLAVCRLAGGNGPDIGAAMVRQGWALAYRPQSNVYAPEEQAARRAKAGLWVGEFTLPWEWRPGR